MAEVFSPRDHSPSYFGGSELQVPELEETDSESPPFHFHIPDSQCWKMLNWLFNVGGLFLNHGAGLIYLILSSFALIKYGGRR